LASLGFGVLVGQKSGYFSSGGAAFDDSCQEFALGEVEDCKASVDLEGDCFVAVNLCVLFAGFGYIRFPSWVRRI
jgi:hypothetical protein